MSYGQPDLEPDLLFMDHSLQNPAVPYNVARCIEPGMMNLFTTDGSTSSSALSSPQFGQNRMPCSSPPPPSTGSESDDQGHTYDVDGLMSPISRRASLDTWPLPGDQAPNRRCASTRADRRRSSASSAPRKSPGQRVPHNLVERKYRNTLNSEMERLRRAIPHLASLSGGDAAEETGGSNAKPSKANILASAVEYIRSMERECDRLRRMNEELQEGLQLPFRRGGMSVAVSEGPGRYSD